MREVQTHLDNRIDTSRIFIENVGFCSFDNFGERAKVAIFLNGDHFADFGDMVEMLSMKAFLLIDDKV